MENGYAVHLFAYVNVYVFNLTIMRLPFVHEYYHETGRTGFGLHIPTLIAVSGYMSPCVR